MSSRPRLSVIIPAAGASRRLGQPKQLVQIEGKTLIRRAIQNAESLFPHEVIVVTGASSEAVQAEVKKTSAQCVDNPDWRKGMGSSIAMGARSMDRKSQGLMILLCDQWRLGPEDLQQLVKTWHNDPGHIVCSGTGDRCGPPVIFPDNYVDELCGLSGNLGAHSVLDRHPASVLRVSLQNAAFDLDTPAQLKELDKA